ncbi:signal recognition particle-docking protein FtsY [Rickettsia endosymbiont of Cardiosporidium cionae]|uniref:signal recognition particle-docking protein FtsY n=1 Tax=Rickettsia endosymbiont of Cardiosporidium cionae TaxID=2777155 RepID=UPI001893D569|nr:signal recognition particle-docking protein FtsY [Rickettsia endosymbiont of Cardiosporidium cionae]KAF8818699.1 signal recognition particle-docking protein FtsY [Rickettsia endosymbiont of Cardiosporidium cionae]
MNNFLSGLKTLFSKTANSIGNQIDKIFIRHSKFDENTLKELEEILILSDVGVDMSSYIIEQIKKSKIPAESDPNFIKLQLSNVIQDILYPQHKEFLLNNSKLNVVLLCGINGSGKTSSIVKMVHKYVNEGKKVAVAACDTFRAAAVEQLFISLESFNIGIYTASDKHKDPASISHFAISQSILDSTDILFLDTAGRLHNNTSLMDELSKIGRIAKKFDDNIEFQSLLVIDSSIGQNSVIQARIFNDCINIGGLIITKLDGTAKAGSVIGIMYNFGLPVYFITMGELYTDLKSFVIRDFVQSLVGI